MTAKFPIFFTILYIGINCVNGHWGNYQLYANMTAATIQLSDLLRHHYHDNKDAMEPHMASSMIVSLRLAGHHPDVLLSDFKFSNFPSLLQHTKPVSDKSKNGNQNISQLSLGQLALTIQGSLALCKMPQEYFGLNVIEMLLAGSKSSRVSTISHFSYSIVVLVLCQSKLMDRKTHNASHINHVLSKYEQRYTYNQDKQVFPDTTAMAIMALTCLRKHAVKRNDAQTSRLDAVLKNMIQDVAFSKQYNDSAQRSWNSQSKGLVVQALQTVPSHLKPRSFKWKRVIKELLKDRDEFGSFSNVLANIQILPVFLGRSLATITDLPCPQDLPESERKNISVCIKLTAEDFNGCVQTIAAPLNLTVLEKSTAFEVLDLASKKDLRYKYEAKEYSFGRSIRTISNITQNAATGFYWMLYSNDTPAKDGVDIFKPENGSCITFKYQKIGQKESGKCPANNTLT